ncbi:MAG: glycosyltransferase, partial [Thermoleophilaceae bacterium]|nr:glycosyltransferase [Thermoleophilaceae bacterium]
MPEGGARPPRVLFVIPRLEPGGSEGQLTELVLRAHPDRLQSTIATLYPTASRRHLDRLTEHGVPVHVLSGGRGRTRALGGALARLPGLIRSSGADVVYAWLEEAAAVAVPSAKLRRVPVAVARRNVCGSSLERHAPLRIAIRRIEASAAVVTANSRAGAEEAVRRGIDPPRVRVVPNCHEPLPALPQPAGPRVRLGCMAHLRPEKGHARLLEALALLPEELDWRADLAGSG